jgi:hypothetical protein
MDAGIGFANLMSAGKPVPMSFWPDTDNTREPFLIEDTFGYLDWMKTFQP